MSFPRDHHANEAGIDLGPADGAELGTLLGRALGAGLGCNEGMADGPILGLKHGSELGIGLGHADAAMGAFLGQALIENSAVKRAE